jgi:diguanylate cyclase (GGDEF)-like protein
VRAVDTVARIGGDEFVVLIADLSEKPDDARAHATAVGEKILAALNEPYQITVQRHSCTSSIGAAMFQDLQLSPADVLKRADMAMYEAKAKGRNMLRFYEETASIVIG